MYLATHLSFRALIIIVGVSLCTSTRSEIPHIINYQGRLTDTEGSAVADGDYDMTFLIYDAETSGTLLWDSGTLSVGVSGGIFSVILGESPNPIQLDFDQDYWLEVQIETDVQMPRERLGAVGYAYMASGLVPGTEVIGEVTVSPFAVIKASNTATSGQAHGVYGFSASTEGIGVHGRATATTGATFGLWGSSASPASGRGVYGFASATTGTNYGVFGRTWSPSGYGVYYDGGLGGTGPMRSIVKTSQGPTGLDALTTAGNWVEDFGEGQLVNGRAHVELDPLFLETVSISHNSPMKVFVQPHDATCRGLAVERGIAAFTVIELDNGSSNGTFDYRVVAEKKGFEGRRLEIVEAARNDHYLYPELREKEMKALEEEKAQSRGE